MAKKSYDWVAIKVQFINSSLSTREFSEKYGIPFGTLTKQVAQGKWLDERITIGSDTEQKSIAFSINNRAVRLAQFDDDCVELADEFRKKAREFLHQVDSPMALLYANADDGASAVYCAESSSNGVVHVY